MIPILKYVVEKYSKKFIELYEKNLSQWVTEVRKNG